MPEPVSEEKYTRYVGSALSVLIILSLLFQDKEHSGYSLIKKIRDISNEKLRFRVGTIYAQIEKLSEKGLILQDVQDIPSREGVIRQKSVYSLTDKGITKLKLMRQEWEEAQYFIGMIVREE